MKLFLIAILIVHVLGLIYVNTRKVESHYLEPMDFVLTEDNQIMLITGNIVCVNHDCIN